MKIFSSFDTNFKNEILERERKIFKDKVLVIQHGRFFYYFLIILPALIIGVLAIMYSVLLIYLGNFVNENLKSVYRIIGIVMFFIIFLPLVLKLVKKYIDYKLDFVIVTPDSLIYYNQEGILNRKGRTIDTEKIKTITVEKNGLLRSIFNFGNIVVLSEGDEQGEGEINFSFVDDPDHLKMKIFEIIKNENLNN